MAEDVFDLLRCLRRGLGQMAANALGPVLDGHRAGQVVKRILPDQPDKVFGRVEARRVHRGVEELYGDPGGEGDFRQQLGQGGLHGVVVDGAVVEDEHDLAETEAGIAQDDQRDHRDGVAGLGVGLEIDRGVARTQVHGQEAVQLLAPLLVARQRRGGVLLRPGVMGVGRGLERELVQGYESSAGGQLGGFFWRSPTKPARCAGLDGP